MTWTATERYRLEPAPGGLGLVQDLLNTVAAGAPARPDLLADEPRAADAQAWADEAGAAWAAATGRPAPHVALDAGAVGELRAFRESLHEALAQAARGEDADPPPVPERSAEVALKLGEDGVVRLESRGTGWRHLVALVLAELYEGQRADTARRLKTCRNPLCRVAFYDRSRNNSGVWHDVKKCGNAANLRAYRARQRER
ncbi:CGNR zinc finger domain-containing protein [Streptomyces atriruber]|uniref:CGNR zinc finger domain-containing protein n=1 Tax=Streptomyces atriruber TaxID=545121 RepID=UPI0006E233A5|nr:CGNR zinc finger domain-containing protein [Streptomyces atriruber]